MTVTGKRLRELRTARGLALRGLTAKSGVSASTLCAIEKWEYLPAPRTRERIAAALGVAVTEIWPADQVEVEHALAAA